MTVIGSYQVKTHLPKVLERVKRGENIVITRRGVPVALLTQPPEEVRQSASQVVEEMLAYRDRQNRTLGRLKIKEMIEEGRRF